MTGTPSRTARAEPRGTVERKLQAKSRPEEHEAHSRRASDGRGDVRPRSPMSSGSVHVVATGRWDEGHVSYPPRSGDGGRKASNAQKSAEVKVAASQRGERAEHEVMNRSRAFDA